MWLDERMNIFERVVGGRRYRIASQSVWDPEQQRPFARQAVLGSADEPPVADLGLTRTLGTRRVGDVGALIWVAEQLDLIKLIDKACGIGRPTEGPTVGEMVLAVAVQRACAPAAKCHLAAFLNSCVPRVSCLPASALTGQTFHRLAAQVTDEHLETAQIEIARAAAARFELSTDLLAFDTTNFDTHIATTTPGKLARRGHAKSKRSDLRVVGLRRGMFHCCTAPTRAMDQTKRCSAHVWPDSASCMMLWTMRSGAAVRPAAPLYAMVVRGANNWNSIWVQRATTRSSRSL